MDYFLRLFLVFFNFSFPLSYAKPINLRFLTSQKSGSNILGFLFLAYSHVGSKLDSFNFVVHNCSLCSTLPWILFTFQTLPSISKFLLTVRILYMQVRAIGAVGYVLITSFLLRENILALVIDSPFTSEVLIWVPAIHSQISFICL